jgi:hypothetical protein
MLNTSSQKRWRCGNAAASKWRFGNKGSLKYGATVMPATPNMRNTGSLKDVATVKLPAASKLAL